MPDARRALPRIDHVGLVVADLDGAVQDWRAKGFSVSDPEPLFATGADGVRRPMGQRSAHFVFENAYVEISAPDPGSDNHLEPYLALGAGVRIVVLTTAGAAAAQAACAQAGLAASPVMEASRGVTIGADAGTARFLWFRLAGTTWPGVFAAAVEHATPDLVFHPGLVTHANGCRRVSAFTARGDAGPLAALPDLAAQDQGVPLVVEPGPGALAITGLTCAGPDGRERFFAFPG